MAALGVAHADSFITKTSKLHDFSTVLQEPGDMLVLFPGVVHQGAGIVYFSFFCTCAGINIFVQGGINLAYNVSLGKSWFSVYASLAKMRKNGIRKALDIQNQWDNVFSEICSMLDNPGVVLMWVCSNVIVNFLKVNIK